ncbi:MAG: nitrogenase [Spirochaetaceae bacterium]|jgi:nitrogenase molybdenum-iron protein alpha chain|nr:nitrogenase [Spirochaetaceae bacterium]
MNEKYGTLLKKQASMAREARLGSITGYNGCVSDLCERSACGTLRNRERCFSQSSMCLSVCAIGQLLGIRDIAVVYHAPSGCCATAAGTNVLARQIAARTGADNNSVLVGTDLDENDTVFGALESLKNITLETYRTHKPNAIFIASSCVSGVIGEDIDSLACELREELPVPVESLHCEGFKSRIWASGFDVADHAVLRSIVKPPKEKRQVINFKNFFESERPHITELFGELGVKPQFLYMSSTVEELEHISESLATVCVCGTLGTYLGNGLEEKYGVPYIRTINFSGIAGFETWMREIGRVIGRETEVESVLKRERERYLPRIEELKRELTGLRAVIGMGPGYTYEVSRVLQELGIKTVWAAAWHFDYRYDNGEHPPALRYLKDHAPNDIGLSVADMQNYEIMNIIDKYKPDVYFSRHPGSTVWAIKQGVAAVYFADEYMALGYRGMLNLAQYIADTIKNRSFEKNLAARTKLPYTGWWYEQNNDEMLLKEAL